MKFLLYTLLIILFITGCDAFCDLHECNNWCINTQMWNIPKPKGANTYKVYGVCEPIDAPPEYKICRCDARKLS